jgi:hypothetical protein
LKKLEEDYQLKVSEGDMEKKKANTGYDGEGFNFDATEKNKINDMRKELSKAYGLSLGDDENGDDDDIVRNTQQKEDERKKKEDEQLLYLIQRDPNARKAAIDAGNQASRNALKQGLSNDEATRVAREAMMLIL